MQYGLSAQTVKKIRDVLVRYPQVEEAALYGSRARGDYKNGSDIDLTLRGGDALTHTILSRICKRSRRPTPALYYRSVRFREYP